MKKIIFSAALFLFLSFGFTNSVIAQDGLLFGQNHFYTVVFRGNGEAITYAKIALTNSNDTPMTEFSFEVPKASPSEMTIYQMKLPQECVSYNYKDPARPCLEYRDPDYAEQYYYYGYSNGKAEYQKIQYKKTGNQYSFTLPTPVDPFKSTAIIVAYATKGYVNQSFGLSKFNFETLKVSSRIQEIRVVVDVDSDLILKGKQSSVNYNTASSEVFSSAAPQSVSSRELDDVVGQIGSYGSLVKEAKNLAPNESFVVKGEYATSWFRLYLNSMLLAIFIIIVIIVAIYFLTKFLKKRRTASLSEMNTQTNPQNPPRTVSLFNITNALVGLLSAALVIGLTYALNLLMDSDVIRSFDMEPMFAMVGFIAIVLLYILVIFVPAIVVGAKSGWKSFVSVLIAQFLWFVVFLIIYLVFFLPPVDYYGHPIL